MFSIFNSKGSIRQYLPEGEPPPKKLETEGDLVVKELAKKQLKTNISLVKQLAKNKEFTASETFSQVTTHISGKANLEEFKSQLVKIDKINVLIGKGLTQKDIKLYEEYTTLESELFWKNHRDVQTDVLKERIDEILKIVNAPVEKEKCLILPSNSHHQQVYLNTVKPQTIENKLLKFATENKVHVRGPMDYLPELDKKLTEEVQDYSKCDLKKIRKKARSLGHQIAELSASELKSACNIPSLKPDLDRKSLWDAKEVPDERIVAVKKGEKVYSCKAQTWYSIKDGQIVKLNKDNTVSKTKLTLEEIKNIPKFANYDPGIPSNKLFLKNLVNNVTPEVLLNLLGNFEQEDLEIKVLGGRMKGQAFVEFRDDVQATQGLEILNGVLVNNRPIIAQYGKKT